MKITSPGLYDLSFEDYFSNICDGHSVSSTGLKLIEQKSLAHYWWDSFLNPQREPYDSEALAFGRACHSWVLGEPCFNQYFVISPYDDFRSKEARTWREQQSRTIIKAEQMAAIKAMTAALQQHPLLKNVFVDGAPERSLVWRDKETQIWLKARPDWLPNNRHIVPDFKSTLSAKPEAFQKQAFSLGYHQSAALTIEGLREVLGWTDASYYFVAQEKSAPYVAMPFVMRDMDLEWGALQNRRSLRKLADALAADKWPAYADGAVEISMPAWSEKLLQDQHERGEFAETQEQAA